MKHNNFNWIKLLILITCISSFTHNLKAQEKTQSLLSDEMQLYNKAENCYAINDELINGFIYTLPNSKITGSPYLFDDQWSEATIFINGKKYPQQFIKYDLILDDIILKATIENNTQTLITINKSQIDSFIIGNSIFISSHHIFSENDKITFYEQIYSGNLLLLRKYKKDFLSTYNNLSPYGKFTSLKSDLLIFDQQQLINVSRKQSFIKFIEKKYKKNIRVYMKSNNMNYGNATSQQFKELMNYCTKE